MWRVLIFVAMMMTTAACNAPAIAPVQPSGELIAFGGGPGGARDACFTCHGLQGEGDGVVPRLAGLSAGYLIKQMEDYAGHWRDEPSMTPISARLSDADRIAVAHYYEALGEPELLEVRSDPEGRQLFEAGHQLRGIRACAECHGANGEGGGLAQPRLAGQSADYVKRQLLDWKAAKRRNDPQDVMGSIARKLSEAEIANLAEHVQALR